MFNFSLGRCNGKRSLILWNTSHVTLPSRLRLFNIFRQPSGLDVTSMDTATVTVETPVVNIVKTPTSQTVLSGGAASFTLTVTNAGNVSLSSVVVTDPLCNTAVSYQSGDSNTNNVLETTETWVYTCTTTNVTADFTNTVMVTGTPPTGSDVTDDDTATVTVGLGSISDLVWNDSNVNGALDPGESGRQGVTLELQDGVCSPGVDCPTMVTDANGNYLFPDLPANTYTVDLFVPTGFVVTTANDPLVVVLADNEVFVDADFGLCADADGDGICDALESCGEDRDGDGVDNCQDFDPTGYSAYCENSGEIVAGGLVTVTGPGNINLLSDGSSGFNQFTVRRPGSVRHCLHPTARLCAQHHLHRPGRAGSNREARSLFTGRKRGRHDRQPADRPLCRQPVLSRLRPGTGRSLYHQQQHSVDVPDLRSSHRNPDCVGMGHDPPGSPAGGLWWRVSHQAPDDLKRSSAPCQSCRCPKRATGHEWDAVWNGQATAWMQEVRPRTGEVGSSLEQRPRAPTVGALGEARMEEVGRLRRPSRGAIAVRPVTPGVPFAPRACLWQFKPLRAV